MKRIYSIVFKFAAPAVVIAGLGAGTAFAEVNPPSQPSQPSTPTHAVEPGTLLLMGLGLGSLAIKGLRKEK